MILYMLSNWSDFNFMNNSRVQYYKPNIKNDMFVHHDNFLIRIEFGWSDHACKQDHGLQSSLQCIKQQLG